MSASQLTRLLAPRHIAVIGASATPGKAGNALMRSLRSFRGSVYPVHPSAPVVAGVSAYRSVDLLPVVPDLALIAVPAQATPEIVRACGIAGVGGAVVHAGGFAEAGPPGEHLQQELAAASRETGIRILGPNTSGFLAPALSLCASFVATAAEIKPGRIAIVAQSGGVNHALAFAANAQGAGIRLAVGLGNAIDVSFPDMLQHLAGDPEVGVVALAIEGIADGRALAEAVGNLVDRIPVVALKAGRADVTDFARSHTGALTGSWSNMRSALRQAGAVIVDDSDELIDAARALSVRRARPAPDPGVGVITGQAGPGLLLTDALRSAQVKIPTLPEKTQQALEPLIGKMTFRRNPVDTGRPDSRFGEAISMVAAAPGIDILAVYMLDEPDAVDVREALVDRADLPLLLGTAGPPDSIQSLHEQLNEHAVAVFNSPERCARAVRALAADSQAQHQRAVRCPGRRTSTAGAGLARGRRVWDEQQAKVLIETVGIATPNRQIYRSTTQAVNAGQRLKFPLVAKRIHGELVHKTEADAVQVGIRDRDELEQALDRLSRARVPATAAYLIEAMIAPGPELLLGAMRDPSFGPVVVLGAGGVQAEALGDTSTRLAPITAQEAAGMLEELTTVAVYRGYRGWPAVDERRLAEIICGLGDLLVARPDLAEIEINPLRVTGDGTVVALDALVIAVESEG